MAGIIKNMNKFNKEGNKTKAFFSVDTKNFTINDCKLVEGTNGLFVSMPSREYVNAKGEKKFQPIIWIKDVDFIKAINDEAVKVYYVNQNPPDESDIPF